MNEGRWDRYVPNEMAGRTVAILGLGYIGEGIARRLGGWDVDVIGITRDPSRYDGVLDQVVEIGQLTEVAHSASVLFVAIAATPDTRHLVSPRVLDALGSGGWLINVARGELVDEPALIERLMTGALGGAALDVFQSEPLPVDSPLWSMSNVICTPHMAGESIEHAQRFLELFLRNVAAYNHKGEWVNRIS
jgi:phosphoglycerate dehydrogenase-like enzyme